MNRKSKLNLVAILLGGGFAATAGGVQQQPEGPPPLTPRREIIKPEHTQVLEAVHRTDVISVRFRDGLMVRLREGTLTDFGTEALLGACRQSRHVPRAGNPRPWINNATSHRWWILN